MLRHLSFSQPESATYPIVFLVDELSHEGILANYVAPYFPEGLARDAIAVELFRDGTRKKTSAADMKHWVEEELAPGLEQVEARYLVVGDSEYFKLLTRSPKAEAYLGYVLDCAFGPWKIVYVPSHRQVFYDPPKVRAKIAQGISGLLAHRSGTYSDPGQSIIRHAEYPSSAQDIEELLQRLLSYPELTCDIEAFSLRHHTAGIGTISFAWDRHNGAAFPVDYHGRSADGELVPALEAARVRHALRRFFEEYQGRLTFHSIAFDVYVLIYQLFMAHILDTEGLLRGMEVMLAHGRWDCTKLITYLATNSCSGNRLDLKSNSQEFSGNYSLGDEIRDITQIELPRLLEYNLVDALSTWYVKGRHEPTMDADGQREIYETLFKPATLDIVQMQLTGMPVDMQRAVEVNAQLKREEDALRAKILAHPIIVQFTRDYLDVEYAEKMNATWVKKRITPAEARQVFNPASDPQIRALFFDWLKLPVVNLTDSKLPSTDGETIEALINRVEDASVRELLEHFQLFSIVGTLTATFMPSILGAVEGPPDEDGVSWHYLFGYFNLGGTLSGRLSSSSPNLQNLPSTGKGHRLKLVYAKLIKSCFAAPPGWLFVGADFPSLEDRISALTTKDPNKLKVYTDGYDGHSLRAYAYFGRQMPDIDGGSVDSVNSIQKKYKPLRDRSKNPTFTLTYQGTWHALVKKYGFTPEQAKEVERLYHELYKVSDAWVNERLDRAMTDGYVTGAFGLRLRTPLLRQVVRGTSKTPYEAEAEGRTAGNALGQSWCMLNSRAWVEFMGRVRASEHRLDVRPCAQIHDAGYALIRDDLRVVAYVNEHLPEAMAWQDHPEIRHDEVKLRGAQLGIYHPDWNTEITLPNGATEAEIAETVRSHLESLEVQKKAVDTP